MKVWIFAQIKTRSESFHTRFEKLPLTTQFFLSAIMKTVLGAKLGHPMAFIRPYVWSTDIPVEKKISFNPAAKEYDIYKQSYQKCQAF